MFGNRLEISGTYMGKMTVPVCELEKQHIPGTRWAISIAMLNCWRELRCL